ncbi:MAG: hypothetical protein D4R63_04255 [Methylococcaceae bacterium]|nr:MAG: hypothetical protein D4R63_04255 [Methylococcaceae bacterium]
MINFAFNQHNDDDNTKPSRVKRRLKRRWKRVNVQDLLTHGLTQHDFLTYSDVTGKALPAGRDNLFSKGVNTPRTIAVFLCLPFCKTLRLNSIMAECSGQLNRWLDSFTQYCHPTTPRRPSRDKLDRWFKSLSKGVTA